VHAAGKEGPCINVTDDVTQNVTLGNHTGGRKGMKTIIVMFALLLAGCAHQHYDPIQDIDGIIKNLRDAKHYQNLRILSDKYAVDQLIAEKNNIEQRLDLIREQIILDREGKFNPLGFPTIDGILILWSPTKAPRKECI
jgi:hypothetical protein